MAHVPPADLLAVTAAAAKQGPGNLLRVVLVVMIVGVVFAAWFLLRGYRGAGRDGQGGITGQDEESATAQGGGNPGRDGGSATGDTDRSGAGDTEQGNRPEGAENDPDSEGDGGAR
ncbi:hypothetical protein ACWCP6_02300 [Streptomyces sp. NPDC002004]